MTAVSRSVRVAAYNAGHPKFPPLVQHGRWVYGFWMIGNDYRNRSELYGAYPAGFQRRIASMFQDGTRVLHAFSGSLRLEAVRPFHPCAELIELVDLRGPEDGRHPTTIADVTDLPFRKGTFDLILSDPPYSKEDGEKYGTGMPATRLVMTELARVARKGANLIWLDTKFPQYRKAEWEMWGTIGLARSCNHRVRMVSIFERR